MIEEIYSAVLGNMRVAYSLDTDTRLIGLCVLPLTDKTMYERRARVHSLAEAKIIGDDYPDGYFGGESMKYGETTLSLKFDAQEVEEKDGETRITTRLASDKGLKINHILTHRAGRGYVKIKTELENGTGDDIRLEMLSTFALWNISPYLDGSGENSMLLHRIRGKWSCEGRLVSETLEDLQLEECWCGANSKSVRFGQVGSMPVKGYFPFAAVEDVKNGVIWGVQMQAPSSWQMEATRADDGVCISGGLADREFGHWIKTVKKGETFSGMEAAVSACLGGIDDVCAALTEAQEDALCVPDCEESLPVIFNEYCTTWGNPSHENVARILDALDGRGIDYFVIDCGWFKKDGVRWDISMGDYVPSDTLFPEGIDKTAELITAHGMRAGIWFEIENVGRMTEAYNNTAHLLKRDGLTLTTRSRRFWDMNDEWVTRYLDERVIEFLKRNKFGYIKVDYNDTIGIGCDDEDSLGEGLRKNMLASAEYFKRMRKEIPDLVIENCASGGNRLEPYFMSLSSMASFSDAHECVEIPIIAASLHRVVLPRQCQIWCVIRKDDSLKRIAYSVSAAFLGRMCLSGDVTELSEVQWDMIRHGIDFYKKAVPIIKRGKTRILGTRIRSFRHPDGYMAVVRENDDGALIVVHCFENAPSEVRVDIRGFSVKDVYPPTADIRLCADGAVIRRTEDWSGYGVLLTRSEKSK